ncbi:MAG: flagellar biosynthesis protein FliQ [bacterium]
MEQLQFLALLQKTLLLILQLSAPVLIVSLVVGFAISIFQSVTQIQEATLTFVPKILAGIFTIIVLAPWMLQVFIASTHEFFDQITNVLR